MASVSVVSSVELEELPYCILVLGRSLLYVEHITFRLGIFLYGCFCVYWLEYLGVLFET
jgi:hypothetical protein